ncbi:hypothetical protein HELRODRAFT_185372 [Helobdella robusta]|uniref:Enoyl-CoA hydratase domain-containing protein 3, mitochondrial n=1 Tax=Helobdella robusta TaxID=6412 RepID=T1FMQ6_HELRO|nr:hypothetical protein HELRODRAFT_185372 [Helobdella robusta]ESO08771.1 hypothetical protein HELRODRAFT_185372 [Helobdella robusta]
MKFLITSSRFASRFHKFQTQLLTSSSSQQLKFASPSSSSSSSDSLTSCLDDDYGIRTITLNNPRKRNALSLEMLQSLASSISKPWDNLRIIVIKATGPVFSSGHDLKELSKERPSSYHADVIQLCSKLMNSFKDIPVPIMAQVQGLATAAGCQLVASCDIAIAAKSARFATPGINHSLFCTTPGVALGRAVPRKAALYMLFTGFQITADEALRFGLISEVVADEFLENEARRIAESISRSSKPVIKLGKKAFYQQIGLNQEAAYDLATTTMVDNLKIRDAQEGIEAFLQKRQPKWNHKG